MSFAAQPRGHRSGSAGDREPFRARNDSQTTCQPLRHSGRVSAVATRRAQRRLSIARCSRDSEPVRTNGDSLRWRAQKHLRRVMWV